MDKNTTKSVNKILLTLGLLFIFEIVGAIPVPWIDTSALSVLSSFSLFEYINTFNGGALSTLSFTAVGISSYITASIVIQLLSAGFPALEEISKLPGGQKKIKHITMVLGAILSIFISIGLVSALDMQTDLLTNKSWYAKIIIAGCHCIGTLVAIFVGETITDKGFCNGISLLIALNIAKGLPAQLTQIGTYQIGQMMIIISVILVTTIMIVFLESSEDRLPTVNSKAQESGLSISSYLPIKINISGVMPIIFASTIFQLISTIFQLINKTPPAWVSFFITYGSVGYIVLSCVIVFIFTFFYSMLIFKSDEVAKYLQINETAIIGVRPGTETEKFLDKRVTKLNLISSVYLSILLFISMGCFLFVGYTGLQPTSLIILVGVAMEIIQKIKIEFLPLKYRKLAVVA